MRAPRFLSHADAAWLHMDEPGNLMVITGVLRLAEPLTVSALRERIVSALLAHERFSWRALDPAWAPPIWTAGEIDVDHHVIVGPTCSDAGLMELVGELMSTPLDRSRPLWQAHLVDLCSRAEPFSQREPGSVPAAAGVDPLPKVQASTPACAAEGSAIILRVHHALGDGVAMMHVLNSLADTPALTYNPRRERTASPFGRARSLVGALAYLVRWVLLKPEPATPLKGPLQVRQGAAVSRALSLEAVKAVGKRCGCTVNDVLLACVTGGLRGYLRQQGFAIPADCQIRVVMPVDLRTSRDQVEQLGNCFGMAFVGLPVGQADGLARLREIHRHVAQLTRTPHAQLIYAILKLAGMLPRQLELLLVRLFGSRASAVATNVPGPREKMTIAGHTVNGLMFWVPRSGRLGLGISVISYAGEVRVGVAADHGLIPEPARIVEFFHQTFAELEAMG